MTRLTRSAALGLTIAALAATPALADPYYNDPNYPLPDSSSSATTTYQDLRSPDARDAADGRGTFNAPDVTVVKVPAKAPSPAPASDGIDWADAGIGAAGVLGLILVAVGGGVAVVKTTRTSRTA